MESARSSLLTYKKSLIFYIFLYFFLSAICSYGLYKLNYWLLSQGFTLEMLLYFGEKCQLGLYGAEPVIDNLLFISPILPYTFVLLFRDPFLASATIGGMALSAWVLFIFRQVWRGQLSTFLATLLLIYVLSSPAFLFLFAQRIYHVILFMLVLTCIFALQKYYVEKVSLDLFIFSVAMGLIAQNTLESLLMCAIFLPAFLIIIHTHQRPYIPILVAGYFPAFTFIAAPLFLGTLYQGEFSIQVLYGLGSQYEANLFSGKGNVIDSLFVFLSSLKQFFLMMIPFWLFWIRIPFFKKSLKVYVSILLVPLLFLFVRIYSGMYVPSVMGHLLFVLFSILLFSKAFGFPFEKNKALTFVISLAYILSFILSVEQSINSSYHEERNFSRALVGLPHYNNLESSKEIALSLKNNSGKILTDDQANYKVVYFTEQPLRFYLPYQREFATVLSNPATFAQFLVVSKNPTYDRIAQMYPEAPFGKMEGFKVLQENKDLILYEREL